MKCLKKVNKSFDYSIKQHETLEYHGYKLHSILSGDEMASKVLNKINTKLEFLYHHSRYLTPAYKRLLCNSLIQSHFDYGCSSWFPILKKKLKVKLQKAPNKYIYTYLLKFISQISHGSIALHKKKLASGWQQSRIPYWEYSFKYWNGFKLRYIHEMFKP